MTIIADKYIPFLFEAVRKEWPDVDIYPMEPEQIDHSTVHDADVLIVRTRTKVDESLLSGSRVQLVCTATIGYDHIDTAYCESHGIRWTACPGCNAQAVCDYVEEALNETSTSVFRSMRLRNNATSLPSMCRLITQRDTCATPLSSTAAKLTP